MCSSADARPGLGEDVAEDRDDLVELLLSCDERRRDLDDRIAPVVRAADETALEERRREEAAEQRLALVVVEGLPRLFVFHELDRVEEARSANVADDREVQQLFERRAKHGLGVGDMLD